MLSQAAPSARQLLPFLQQFSTEAFTASTHNITFISYLAVALATRTPCEGAPGGGGFWFRFVGMIRERRERTVVAKQGFGSPKKGRQKWREQVCHTPEPRVRAQRTLLYLPTGVHTCTRHACSSNEAHPCSCRQHHPAEHHLSVSCPPSPTLTLTANPNPNPNLSLTSSDGHRHTSERRPRARHGAPGPRRGGAKPSERRVCGSACVVPRRVAISRVAG